MTRATTTPPSTYEEASSALAALEAEAAAIESLIAQATTAGDTTALLTAWVRRAALPSALERARDT